MVKNKANATLDKKQAKYSMVIPQYLFYGTQGVPPQAGSTHFDCFGLLAYRSGLEWNFYLVFTYFMQNLSPIAGNFSNSKFIPSTKSYARSTKPHFSPFKRHFLGPTHLTFLPGKLARSKLLGYILHIFFGKAPRFCRCLLIQDRSHLRPLNVR